MENPFEPRGKRAPKASRLMAFDAWVDSTLYDWQFKLAEIWEGITVFFRRFRFTGWRRLVFELLGEGATMGAVGTVVLLVLAMPAFDETEGDWQSQGDFAVTFLDRYGQEVGQRGIIQRDSIPVDELPDHVIKAVLATEDRRFFDHYGIDFFGLRRALSENMRANSVVQGGSTLTQQLAKNLFLTSERTIDRKIKEAFLAVWLEMNLSKKQILQLYLDRGYMGGGTFGIAAASDFYFGKGVKDLTLSEAAMLAGLFKAPAKYAPHVNLPAARARANTVLSNMVESGFMTEGQVLSARLHPASIVDRGAKSSADYYLDWAFEEVKRIVQEKRIRTHSLVARTTLDSGIQQTAEDTLDLHIKQYGGEYGVTEGAMVVIETNGAVRAIVGGLDYGSSQFNRATKALRQTGSSFKPYVYATAMEQGFTPDTLISDGPINWGGWSPKNYTRGYAGTMTLTTALVKSINTVPVRLAMEHLGIDPIRETARKMGVESPLSEHKTMVLGISGMTVMDQATGYSVFAEGGMTGLRHGVTQLLTHSGDVIYDFSRDAPKPRRVMSEQAVKAMNEMMVQVPEVGTARRAALPGIRSAGKTGTTQAYRDAWYVGFTGNYTAAVWLGNDDFRPTRNMTGGSLPAMVWERVMEFAHQSIDIKPIPYLDQPFVDEKVAAKAVAAAKKASDGIAASSDRPRVLTSTTTRLLREMSETFRTAPRLDTPPEPSTLSSL